MSELTKVEQALNQETKRLMSLLEELRNLRKVQFSSIDMAI